MKFKYFSLIVFPIILGIYLFTPHPPNTNTINNATKPISVVVSSAEDDASFKEITFDNAKLINEKNKVVYNGKLDDSKKFSASYQYSKKLKTFFITVKMTEKQAGIKLGIRKKEDGNLVYNLLWKGQKVASAQAQINKSVDLKVSDAKVLQTDEFHIMQYLPHEMKGISPNEIFGGGNDQVEALNIFEKIGKWLGGIKIKGNCSKKKVTRYICSQTCTLEPGNPECSGSMCGSICCCGSCTSEEIIERECGGEVSVGQ